MTVSENVVEVVGVISSEGFLVT